MTFFHLKCVFESLSVWLHVFFIAVPPLLYFSRRHVSSFLTHLSPLHSQLSASNL